MGNLCLAPNRGAISRNAFEDPATAQRTNALLNRWRSGEVTLLQRLYRRARLNATTNGGTSASTNGSRPAGLDRNAFNELFHGLSVASPHGVCDAAFDLFDSNGNGHVSFRDFCRTLSW